MKIGEHDWHLDPLGKHIWRGRIEAGQLLALARAVKEEGGQLIALWGSDNRHLGRGFAIHAALLT
ncbi:MAG: Ni,Fe-hydrogenase III large subunit, partial [Thiobacillus sp.]